MSRSFLLVAAVSAFSVLSCKGGDKPADKGAEKAGEAAAATSNHDKFQGTWAVDIERMLTMDPRAAEMIKAKPEMKEMMTKTMSQASFTVTKDGISVTGFGKDQKAAYTVKKDEGSTLVIESQDEGKEEKESITITFDSADTATMTKDGQDQKMPLKRK